VSPPALPAWAADQYTGYLVDTGLPGCRAG
jgi:hypothetical protein